MTTAALVTICIAVVYVYGRLAIDTAELVGYALGDDQPSPRDEGQPARRTET